MPLCRGRRPSPVASATCPSGNRRRDNPAKGRCAAPTPSRDGAANVTSDWRRHGQTEIGRLEEQQSTTVVSHGRTVKNTSAIRTSTINTRFTVQAIREPATTPAGITSHSRLAGLLPGRVANQMYAAIANASTSQAANGAERMASHRRVSQPSAAAAGVVMTDP